jgi:S1-C subfamily serine protease
MVVGLEPSSPAEQAGFRLGDIIAKINDKEIEDLNDYYKTSKPLKEEKKAILFLIYRDGEPLFVAVKPD